MKKKSLLLVVLLSAFVFLLAGCNEVVPTLDLDKLEFTTLVGDEVTIKPTVVYDGKETLTLQYASDNEAVATVENGVVNPLAQGLVNITISIKEYPDVKVVAQVTVKPVVTEADFIPTELLITGLLDSYMVGDEDELKSDVIPLGANPNVIWSSSNPEVATITADGILKLVAGGNATITAVSALNKEIKDERAIVVNELGTDVEIAERILNYVGNELPEFITATFNLPKYPNPNFVVQYFDANESPIGNGKYVLRTPVDTYDKLTAIVEINGVEFTREYELKVVLDLENNNIERAEFVKLHFDEYFAQFANGVTGDLDLYDHILGAAVSWNTNVAAVISKDGLFVKPDNDTQVVLSGKITSGSINIPLRYEVKAVGYTIEEKVAHIQANTLAAINNKTIEYSTTLPLTDSKFGATLTWVADKPAILNNQGQYPDKLLTVPTDVLYTVTIGYAVEGFAFTQPVEVLIHVNPMTATGKAAFDFEAAVKAGTVNYTQHVAYGSALVNQVTGLPVSLVDHETVTINWSGVNDEFDADLIVQKQYLLYHPTKIVGTFSAEGVNDSIVELPVNIGILNEGEFAITARTKAFFGEGHLNTDGMPADDGGTGSVYKLGFAPVYLKSTFNYVVGTGDAAKDYPNTYYFFTAKGNYIEWNTDVVEEVNGVQILKRDPADATLPIAGAKLAVGWASCLRIYKNNTDKDLVINIADWSALGFNANAGAVNAYRLHTVGPDNIVKTANKVMLINTIDFNLKADLKVDDSLNNLYTLKDGVYTKNADGLKFVEGDTNKYYERVAYATTNDFVEKTLAVGDSLVGLYTREDNNAFTKVNEGTFAEGSTVKYYEMTTVNTITVPAHGYLFSPAYLDQVNLNAMLGAEGRVVEVLPFVAK